jgi:hypothetical protein
MAFTVSSTVKMIIDSSCADILAVHWIDTRTIKIEKIG